MFNYLIKVLLFSVVIILLTGWQAVSAQDTADDEVIKVTTEFISIPLVISGSSPIRLSSADITVYEDGKKQQIEEFVSAEAPFEVALLLDTSGSARAELDLIKRSARHFINSLRPGDKVAVIGFHSGEADGKWHTSGQILSELTADRSKLNKALDLLSVSNSTPFYDTLITISDVVFKKTDERAKTGRRAIVMLTDGVDSASNASFESAFARLNSLNASAYILKVDTQSFFEDNLLGNCIGAMRFSITQIRRYYAGFKRANDLEQITDFCKLGDFERLDISNRMYDIAGLEMKHMAETTGGGIYPVSTYRETQKIFGDVARELGTVLTVGYYSSNELRDGKFRKITIEIKNLPPDAKIKARTGYYAGKD